MRPIDIRQTIEYRVADWLNRNGPYTRVFAPGSMSVWLNAFTDTPQLAGCCDQSSPNFESLVAGYTVYTDQNAGIGRILFADLAEGVRRASDRDGRRGKHGAYHLLLIRRNLTACCTGCGGRATRNLEVLSEPPVWPRDSRNRLGAPHAGPRLDVAPLLRTLPRWTTRAAAAATDWRNQHDAPYKRGSIKDSSYPSN